MRPLLVLVALAGCRGAAPPPAAVPYPERPLLIGSWKLTAEHDLDLHADQTFAEARYEDGALRCTIRGRFGGGDAGLRLVETIDTCGELDERRFEVVERTDDLVTMQQIGGTTMTWRRVHGPLVPDDLAGASTPSRAMTDQDRDELAHEAELAVAGAADDGWALAERHVTTTVADFQDVSYVDEGRYVVILPRWAHCHATLVVDGLVFPTAWDATGTAQSLTAETWGEQADPAWSQVRFGCDEQDVMAVIQVYAKQAPP